MIAGVVAPATTTEPKIIGYAGPRRKILVIDDQATNRNLLVNMLTPLGFELAEFDNGQEALQGAAQWQPDLVLLDLLMPGTDGFEVARGIRTSAIVHRLVIIAVSASVFESVKQKSRDAGCDDFLSKPVQMKHLLRLLQQHLHLEWLYTEADLGSVSPEAETPQTGAAVSFDALPAAHLAALRQQAQRGNVKAVLRELEAIEQLGSEFGPLVRELKTLAKGFQIDTLVERLEQATKQEP